eukprot:380097_1
MGKRAVLLVGLLVGAPFGLPLFPSGKTEYASNLKLGFALNDNECQIFEKRYGQTLSFDVEDADSYNIYCGAIFDAYDYGYISGIYCNLYQPNSDDATCKFWMYE